MQDEIRSKAAEVAGKARHRVENQYNRRLEQAANEIHHLASALRGAADNLRKDGASSLSSSLLTRAAARLDTLGSSFTAKDLDGIIGDVERLARRNPAAFIGGAMLIGFVASRFLKSGHGHGRPDSAQRYEAAALPDFGATSPGIAGGTAGTGFGPGNVGGL